MKTLLALLLSGVAAVAAEDALLREKASKSLRQAVGFFREKVAVEGTYLWQYSEDLAVREGETAATMTMGWVQPPGTPAVGAAILDAYDATRDQFYLDAAREVGAGLLKGQLQSGGWTYSIGFAREERRRFAYRVDGRAAGRNVTTFDDDTTQAALRFLMRLDRALQFSDAKIHEAVEFCINSMVKAQYPNGAWPQGYEKFPEADKFSVRKANYPEAWPRIWPGAGEYWLRYTLNDNSHATIIASLIEAEGVYKGSRFTNLVGACGAAIQRAADFILMAQMPEPQPAWAQQYDFQMHPSWARKFEPPAVSAGESQHVIRALFELYRRSGEAKFLEPIPRALAYLRKCRLSDGRLARFYELQSNKPLYFTRDYQLTYDDKDVPTHYAFKIADNTEALEREFEALKREGRAKSEGRPKISSNLVRRVEEIIATQDSEGRWVEAGQMRSAPSAGVKRVIRSATFNRNVEALVDFLWASAAAP